MECNTCPGPSICDGTPEDCGTGRGLGITRYEDIKAQAIYLRRQIRSLDIIERRAIISDIVAMFSQEYS